MKRFLAIFLTLIMSALLFVSCADEEKTPARDPDLRYQFDLTPYIEIEESDYKGIELTRVDSTLTDDDLNDAIASVLDEHAELVEVTDAAAKLGDTANIDFKGYVDGEAFEGGEGTDFDLELGSGSFIPGFEEAIVGHFSGEDFTIDVTFPENYHEELAGKAAQFEITINSLKTPVYPDFNEEFVKEISDYETIEEYLAGLTETLTEEKQYYAESQMNQDAFYTIYENVKIIEYPQPEYDFYYNDYVTYYEDLAKSQYGCDLDTFITTHANSTREEFEYYADASAKSMIEQDLIIFSIANKLGIINALTDEDYNAHLAELAESIGITADEVETQYGETEVWKDMVLGKVLDYVIENANIVDPALEASKLEIETAE